MTSLAGRSRIRAALVQMCSGRDVDANVRDASALIRDAAKGGADYVQTPEITTLMEPERSKLFAAVQSESGNRALSAFAALARELKIWLHIGSMGVLVAPDKVANRGYLISPSGIVAASYDKIHMFDVDLPGGESYRESKNYRPGNQAIVAGLPWGRLGLTVCYDMRFAGLYRALAQAGADVIAVPSAFTVPTGKAHWHVLLRARAIETGCYILAAAQAGRHETGRETYGHSIVIAPWGEILAEADGVQTSVIFSDIELNAVLEARQRIPALTHDRPFTVTTLVTEPTTEATQ
jgi:deaminated glutathione amidase